MGLFYIRPAATLYCDPSPSSTTELGPIFGEPVYAVTGTRAHAEEIAAMMTVDRVDFVLPTIAHHQGVADLRWDVCLVQQRDRDGRGNLAPHLAHIPTLRLIDL
jgi:hypothetical protein